MLKSIRFLTCLALISLPVYGQSQLALGETCAGEPLEERACLSLEFHLAHLVDLRDEITGSLEPAGGGPCGRLSCDAILVCDQCSVDKLIPGCERVGDKAVLGRWSITAHRVACFLTSIRGQKLERDAKAIVVARLNRAADIGVGLPVVKDRRPAVEIKVEYNLDGSEQRR